MKRMTRFIFDQNRRRRDEARRKRTDRKELLNFTKGTHKLYQQIRSSAHGSPFTHI